MLSSVWLLSGDATLARFSTLFLLESLVAVTAKSRMLLATKLAGLDCEGVVLRLLILLNSGLGEAGVAGGG